MDALEAFAKVTGQSADIDADPATVIGDLLANLHHLADFASENGKSIDWNEVVARGEHHYVNEVLIKPAEALDRLQTFLSGRELSAEDWGAVLETMADAGYDVEDPNR